MTKKRRHATAPSECPVCGATVPASASACPECGADERTGWDEEKARYDGLNLPDDSFDYDEALKDEGLRARRRPKRVTAFWWIVAIIATLVFVKMVIYRQV